MRLALVFLGLGLRRDEVRLVVPRQWSGERCRVNSKDGQALRDWDQGTWWVDATDATVPEVQHALEQLDVGS